MEAAAIPTKHDDRRTAHPLPASNETPKICVIPGGQAADRTPPRHARAPMNCADAPICAPAPTPAPAAPRAVSLLARASNVLARAQGVGFDLTRRERALAAAAGTVLLLMALAAAIL
ncbi:hypothetical protein [Rubneribacter sp.]